MRPPFLPPSNLSAHRVVYLPGARIPNAILFLFFNFITWKKLIVINKCWRIKKKKNLRRVKVARDAHNGSLIRYITERISRDSQIHLFWCVCLRRGGKSAPRRMGQKRFLFLNCNGWRIVNKGTGSSMWFTEVFAMIKRMLRNTHDELLFTQWQK